MERHMRDFAIVLLSAVVVVALTYWMLYSLGVWQDHLRGLAANVPRARELAVRRTLFLAGLFIAFACINLLIARRGH
jgi:succinate dehydrogenase hydrophobic anchor subunit